MTAGEKAGGMITIPFSESEVRALLYAVEPAMSNADPDSVDPLVYAERKLRNALAPGLRPETRARLNSAVRAALAESGPDVENAKLRVSKAVETAMGDAR